MTEPNPAPRPDDPPRSRSVFDPVAAVALEASILEMELTTSGQPPLEPRPVPLPLDDPLVRSVIDFLRQTAAIGCEVPTDLDGLPRSARDDLQAILVEWSDVLELLVRRPVAVPPLAEWDPGETRTLTAIQLRDRLRDPWGKVHRYQVSDPDDQLADLTHLDMHEQELIEVGFKHCNLTGARMGATTTMARARFDDCLLDTVSASGTLQGEGTDEPELGGALSLLSCAFVDCHWGGANFEGATFSNCSFDGMVVQAGRGKTMLSRASFNFCHMPDIEFVAELERAVFTDTNLDRASFARLILENVSFTNCSLANANFDGARLVGVSFINCELSGASFRPSRVTRQARKDSELEDVDFSTSFNIGAVNVSDARVRNCQFPQTDRDISPHRSGR